MAYISSNANRWYVGQESAYGQVPAITPGEPDSRSQADGATAAGEKSAQGQDRQPDVAGSAGGDAAADHVRHDVLHEGLAGSYDIAVARAPLSRPQWARLASYGRGTRPAWAARYRASYSLAPMVWRRDRRLRRRRNPVCRGDRRCADSYLECAAFGCARRGRADSGRRRPTTSRYELPSVSIFDYWDPSTAVQRVLCGAAVDG